MDDQHNIEIEELRLKTAMLQQQVVELSSKENSLTREFKMSMQQVAVNTVRDLPTTLMGVIPAAAIAFSTYPNIDFVTGMEILGFAGVGAASNSKGATRVAKQNQAFNKNQEYG